MLINILSNFQNIKNESIYTTQTYNYLTRLLILLHSNRIAITCKHFLRKHMKALILALTLTAAVAYGADMNGGVVYINNNVQSRLITQSGITPKPLVAGNTYAIDGYVMMEMDISNKTILYFGNGPIVEASPNSLLTINSYLQEVNNINVTPRTADFGQYNLVLSFARGEFSVIVPNNTNSYLEVLTWNTDDPYTAGKYVFVVSETNTVVNVVDGGKVPDRKTRKNGKPLKTKTTTATTLLTQEQINKYTPAFLALEAESNNVRFFIIDGQVRGIWMK